MKSVPQPIRRVVNRVVGRVTHERADFVYGSEYGIDLPGVPLDGRRGEKILTALFAEGIVTQRQIHRPPKASLKLITRVHDLEYVRSLTEPLTMESAMGMPVPPRLAEELIEHQRYMTGGTVLAARLAWGQRRLVVNLGGGMHHAHARRGGGFCLFNDLAVAVAELRARGYRRRILVIDLDLHDGDGTRDFFAQDPTVWTLSIHNEHWGETEAVASTSIALGAEVGDRDYLAAVRRHVNAVVDEHRPDLVFFVGGTDPARGDELGNWSISEEGMMQRDRIVFEALRRRGIRSVVWVLAGGYGHESWRHSARSMMRTITGRRIDPPTTEAVTLMRYRVASRLIDPRLLTGELEDPFVFEEADLIGGIDPLRGPERWLGFYTRHGVEMALEQYGVLERLRKLGFDPQIEFTLGRPEGDTMRIFGSPGRRERLMELRVARDRQTLPEYELLSIEWLLMQNPRARWIGGRRPLPGQTHPGLGMFADVLALLLVSCDRIGLDGIVVVPSHFHVAARWRERLRFLDPEAEGRFRAIQRALPGRSIAECTRVLEGGAVTDAEGEPVHYVPAAMVYPVNEELRRRIEGRAYEQRAEEVAAATHVDVAASRGPVRGLD